MLSDKLLREFDATVQEWYPIARSSIMYYQTEEGRRAVESITELRDVLDHFWLASSCDDEERASAVLADARDHLRTVAVEPLERAVEDRFNRVQQSRGRVKGVISMVVLIKPPSASVVTEAEELVKSYVREGRSLKGNIATAEQAVAAFKNAHKEVIRLENLYRVEHVKDRVFVVISGVAILIVGVLIGKIWG